MPILAWLIRFNIDNKMYFFCIKNSKKYFSSPTFNDSLLWLRGSVLDRIEGPNT